MQTTGVRPVSPIAAGRVALALLVVVTVLVAVAIPSGASTADGTPFASWPWEVAANGAPIGAACTFRFWSVTDGTIGSNFAWNDTTQGEINYNCDGITQPSKPTAQGGCDHSPLLNFAVGPQYIRMATSCPLGTDGYYGRSYSGQLTKMAQSFHGTSSSWFRIQGQVTFIKGCQFDGAASSASCGGGHGPGGTGLGSNPTVDQECQPATADKTLNGNTGKSYIIPDDSISGDAVAVKCIVEGGTNSSGYSPPPDGSPTPNQGAGTCSFSVMTATLVNTSGASTLTTDSVHFLQVRPGDVATFTAPLTYTGSTPLSAYLLVSNSDLHLHEQISMTVNASGANVSASWTGDANHLFVRVAMVVYFANGTGCERDWDSTPGDQYSGPPGGGPIDQCANNDCMAHDETGQSSVAACFDGFFTSVEFFGLASFPWVHITKVPSVLWCVNEVIVIGTPAAWTLQITKIVEDVQAGPLGSVLDIASVPFNGWNAFNDAYSSGGSCEGPTMNMPMRDSSGGGTHTTSISPFSTCDSNMANAAGMVRLAFDAVLWIGAAWFCFKVVSAALGFSPGQAAASGED